MMLIMHPVPLHTLIYVNYTLYPLHTLFIHPVSLHTLFMHPVPLHTLIIPYTIYSPTLPTFYNILSLEKGVHNYACVEF